MRTLKWRTEQRLKSEKHIREEVLTDEDYLRMKRETAEKMNLPPDVVDTVIDHFVLTLNKFAFNHTRKYRISCFGFFNINLRRRYDKAKEDLQKELET